MTRREFVVLPTLAASPPAARPNILWICTDQQRWDTIAALGNRVIRTPNIGRLVREGVAFTNAYCQSPVCTPSRASFLTGCRPSTIHQHRNGNAHFPAELAPRLVSSQLAKAGYDCGLIGKLHLASPWERVEPRSEDGYRLFEWSHHPKPEPSWPVAAHAYQRWLQQRGVRWPELYQATKIEGYPDVVQAGMPAEHHEITWSAERARNFIGNGLRAPWMLSLNMFAPHPPFDPAPEYLRRMDPRAMPRPVFHEGQEKEQQAFARIDHQTQQPQHPDSYDSRRMKAAYYAMIEHIDWAVGTLLDKLHETGQRERTMVILTSDHGEMLGDHGLLYKGCRFFEGAVHVPLIISWPGGGVRQGATHDALVELTDIAPTLLAAAGVSAPAEMDGRSLLPALRGEAGASELHDCVICEYHDALALPDRTRATMLRDKRHKLVVYHGRGLGELFDLADDPTEIRNLWADPAARGIRQRLTERMMDTLAQSSDLGTPRIGKY